MKNLFLQALREEIKHLESVSERRLASSLTRIADRYELLLRKRAKERIAAAEQQAQEERDLYNKVMGTGQH